MPNANVAERFGVKPGFVVQEFGYDEDVDFDVRSEIETAIGGVLEDEDYRGVADVVIGWWRSDDGDVDDLADFLVDCAASLDSGAGVIWCLVPAQGSDYHVPTSDVAEAARTAGQSATTTLSLSPSWQAIRVTAHGY
ncbi:MAG: DUF3052 domain-containing protein [Actinomycetaceae bacterium]|nr:DUF3052 domain-containing protein [Arcanobacterium sp.]MDD7686345.1 DUF3052 domain-containing protein [Actinomycetaceae bacterium]MDY5274204.1 DUF3052 domain-containing protein [Arcanobacterium sp.]